MTQTELGTYIARCERSGGWWAITVPELKGLHTQAKRLDQVEPVVRDAIALVLNIPSDSFDVDVEPKLHPEAEDAVRQLSRARQEIEDAQAHFSAATRTAATALVGGMGLTVRDAGRILGVPQQRIDQLIHGR
jgi:predicted RNase H-like HicB family nuclease